MCAIRVFAACAVATALGGCGVFTPEMGFSANYDYLGGPTPQGEFEFNVVSHIKCEIRTGILKAMSLPEHEWLRKLGAQVTLKLIAQDQSALNPNASFLKPFGVGGAESFVLGIGGAGTANATRTETIQFNYSNTELWHEISKSVTNTCESFQKGVMIDSDLKIGQFIYDKAVVATNVARNKGQPFSQLQFEINFVASLGGNITPTWKFTRTTVNGSGTLFSATRTQTNNVIITLGPPTADTKALHNAALIGSATGQSIQSNARTGPFLTVGP